MFGFRTQYGGGKSTGFALIYDSHEVMKKFEPHYRLVRIGAATKIEKASRQQRTSGPKLWIVIHGKLLTVSFSRQATQKPSQDSPGYGEDEGSDKGQEEEVELGRFGRDGQSVFERDMLECYPCFYISNTCACIVRRIGKQDKIQVNSEKIRPN